MIISAIKVDMLKMLKIKIENNHVVRSFVGYEIWCLVLMENSKLYVCLYIKYQRKYIWTYEG
jgi:hypothetical protein